MKYRKEIHELVDKIESEKSLKRIHKIVRHLWINEDSKEESKEENAEDAQD